VVADDLRQARDELGAAVRALVDTVAGTAADEAQLTTATQAITALATDLATAGERPAMIDNPFHPSSLVGGTAHPFGPQVALRQHGNDIVGETVLGRGFEGGPGLSHGGILAMIFDHAMGSAMYVAGYAAMTRTLDVRYCAPTRLGIPIQVAARVDRVEGRRVIVGAEITQEGVVTAEAEAVFVQLTDENVAAIFARTGSS
jgi:hypothetical protein